MNFNEISGCVSCPLHKKCLSPIKIDYIPNSKKKILVIAERPSREEDNLQMAWVDRHNRYIKDQIQKAFLSYPVNFTYIVKCATSKSGLKNTRYCANKWLLREIKYIEPKLILSMGVLTHKILLEELLLTNFDFQQDFLEINGISVAFFDAPHTIFSGSKNLFDRFRELLTKSRLHFERHYHD